MRNLKQYATILLLLCVLIITVFLTVSCNEGTDPSKETTFNETTTAADETTNTTETTRTECPHDITEWVVDATATCTEEGSKHKECSLCKESLETAVIAKTAHTEEIVSGKAATCSENGLTDGKKCSVCNTVLVEQQEIATINHTEEIIESQAATCTQIGLTSGKKCSVCDAILVEQQEIPAINHTEVIIEGKAATCTEAGLTSGKKCSVCDTILIEQQEIPTINHTEVIIEGKAATCTEAGLTSGKKCSVCDAILVEQQEIPTINHTEVIIEGKAATCTEAGLTSGKKCSVCDAILVEQSEIPTINHTEVIIEGKAATCTEAGLTSGKKCSVCDTILIEQSEIPTTNHTEVIIEGKAATCTEAGLTSGKKCSVCDTILAQQQEISILGHNESDWIIDKSAEIGIEGAKHRECTKCGEILKTESIPALIETHSHEGVEWIVVTPPTCSRPGTKNFVCVCGMIMDTDNIDVISHSEETILGKAPTCTSTGLTDGKKCSVCDAILVEQSEIPMSDHTEEIIIGISATCTSTGLTDGKKCSVCDAILVEQSEIPMADHTEEIIIGTSATCTSTGLTDGKKCSVCNAVLKEPEIIPVAPHTEETIHGKAPTCTETGFTDGKKCSVCNAVLKEPEAIPVAPHTEETIHGKAPTCTETGLTDGKKCSICNAVLKEPETIPVAPHTEQIILGTNATCTSTGLTEGKKCSVCDKILVSQTATAKTPHTEVSVLGVSPTCTESGLTDGKKCSVCTAVTVAQMTVPPTGHSFSNGTCSSCGINEPYGLWIVDGQGNPMSDVIVKIMKNCEQIKMYPYNGEFLSINVDPDTYQVVLDLSQLSESYVYDDSLCVLTPQSRTATIRLFKQPTAADSLFVGYPISADYPAYRIEEGATLVTLTPNDYTFFIFAPTVTATYTVTYECSSDLEISYHGGTFFVQGSDLTDSSSDLARYENGISINVYSSNIGGEYVIGVRSTTATSCVISIKNAGDPGTRIEDAPWTPYLEDEDKVAEQLNMSVEGTYQAIDLTDLSITAVYNESDGYYHLGSEDGAIIFIDLTSDSRYISSIQTICGHQRMGSYIYDGNGNVVEKRSYNELFIQYGMPDNADTPVDPPIRVPLTAKLAEAIKSFGDRNGWWTPDSDTNIFTPSLLGAPYNQEYAWLLYCGYYS